MTATLRINIYGADRRPLEDDVRIIVQREDTGIDVARVRLLDGKLGFVENLDAGTVYAVRVMPERYRPVGKFVRIGARGSELAFHCPVRPEAVKGLSFDPPFEFGRFGEAPLGVRAGLRNVWAKMESFEFTPGYAITFYVHRIIHALPDRIWFLPLGGGALYQLVRSAAEDGRLREVSGALHPSSLPRLGSFKSPEQYGGLQLTFFGDPNEPLVEADIDEASGIGHLFQVLRNALPGVETNPYDIGEILRFHQELEPGYRLIV